MFLVAELCAVLLSKNEADMKTRSIAALVACFISTGIPILAGCAETTEDDLASAGSELDSCFEAVDITKLTACGGGAGHCFEKARAPLADNLVACATPADVCVPDEVLMAGGGKLKSCTSIVGAGACITSALIPDLEKNKAYLKQDVCSTGQLCAPCTDPTKGNAPTPFCKPIGGYKTKDKELNCSVGGSSLPKPPAPPPPPAALCCTSKAGKSNGTCLAETAIPEKNRKDAKQDTCSSGEKCVPTAFLEGKPVACKPGLLGGKGVCLDKCFNDMLKMASIVVGRDVCGDTEACIPCSFAPQGTPGCS
jgi:hypothetical protein